MNFPDNLVVKTTSTTEPWLGNYTSCGQKEKKKNIYIYIYITYNIYVINIDLKICIVTPRLMCTRKLGAMAQPR